MVPDYAPGLQGKLHSPTRMPNKNEFPEQAGRPFQPFTPRAPVSNVFRRGVFPVWQLTDPIVCPQKYRVTG